MDQGQGQMIVHFQPSFTELLSENQDQDLRLVMKNFLKKLSYKSCLTPTLSGGLLEADLQQKQFHGKLYYLIGCISFLYYHKFDF